MNYQTPRGTYDILPEDYYDYVVVDEFHHAAAPTYQGMLEHFKPKILLGLTATPERADGPSQAYCPLRNAAV